MYLQEMLTYDAKRGRKKRKGNLRVGLPSLLRVEKVGWECGYFLSFFSFFFSFSATSGLVL